MQSILKDMPHLNYVKDFTSLRWRWQFGLLYYDIALKFWDNAEHSLIKKMAHCTTSSTEEDDKGTNIKERM